MTKESGVVQRFAQHKIKGRSQGRWGIVMSLCLGRCSFGVLGVRLEVVAGSNLDLQVVDLVECRDGEGSSTVTQTKGGGKTRSDDHIAVDGE